MINAKSTSTDSHQKVARAANAITLAQRVFSAINMANVLVTIMLKVEGAIDVKKINMTDKEVASTVQNVTI